MSGMKDTYFGDTPYPAAPGFKEPTTSRDAARGIAPRADTLRGAVFAEIMRSPKTADEVAAAIGETVLAVRPRVTELRKMNVIRPRVADGRRERRPNESGAMATVWEENA